MKTQTSLEENVSLHRVDFSRTGGDDEVFSTRAAHSSGLCYGRDKRDPVSAASLKLLLSYL